MKNKFIFYCVEKSGGNSSEHFGVGVIGRQKGRLSGCEIRIYPENPDVKIQMRSNPGNHIGDIEIYSDAKSGFVRKMRMWSAKKSGRSPPGYRNLSGCEIRNCPENPGFKMRRNPGNHIGDIEICSDAKSGFVRKIRM